MDSTPPQRPDDEVERTDAQPTRWWQRKQEHSTAPDDADDAPAATPASPATPAAPRVERPRPASEAGRGVL